MKDLACPRSFQTIPDPRLFLLPEWNAGKARVPRRVAPVIFGPDFRPRFAPIIMMSVQQTTKEEAEFLLDPIIIIQKSHCCKVAYLEGHWAIVWPPFGDKIVVSP